MVDRFLVGPGEGEAEAGVEGVVDVVEAVAGEEVKTLG